VLRTVLRQAADPTAAGPDRGRRLARAAHRSAEVTGDLRAVPRLLAAARGADPHADTRLPWVTAAAAKQLHGDGDIDTSHRMLLEALESSLLDGHVDGDIDGRLDDDIVDALHLLLDVCASGGRDELWSPVLRLLERCRPQLPDTLQVADAAAPALGPLLTAVDGLSDEHDPRRIVRVATAASDLDRGTGCGDALRRVVRDGRSGVAVASGVNALRILALDAYQEGRWTAAEDLAGEALDICADRGLPLLAAPARWCLALVAAARGDDIAVSALTDELTAWSVPRGARRLVVHAGQARALAALGRGDFDDAWREATAVGPPGLVEPRNGPVLWATLDLVEAATRTHRFPEARTHVAAVRAALTPAHSPRLALLTAGATAMAASDDRAGALYEAAFALPDAQRWPFDLARLRLAHGEQLRRARSTTAAREQLLLALGTFTDLGARPWVARASTELRAAGHPTDEGRDGPRRAGQASLTAQEREVAGLAASGMTNRQIADRLHLSRRTVDAHLYRVFPKLGITGRAALRDALDRPGDRHAGTGQDTDVPPEPAAQPGSPRSDSPRSHSPRSDVTPPRSTP
jgi:DNA-binding CsgD family transcriptional regulator